MPGDGIRVGPVNDGSIGDVSVEARGLWKSFDGPPVLRDVGLVMRRGEIHALVGANGSGKTTLVKVLCGNHRPDAGTVIVRGTTYEGISSPKKASDLGIRVVHQEAPLIDILSVAECMALFRRYHTGVAGRIQWRAVYREAEEILTDLGIDIDPKTLAGSLSAPERALVALAVAFAETSVSDVSLLILDEASASVPEADAERFLSRVRGLAERGLPILMVTHRLKEVAALADRVTVLDDGRVAYQGPAAEVTIEEMVDLMSGERSRPTSLSEPQSVPPMQRQVVGGLPSTSHSVVDVRGLSTAGLHDLGFSVAAGEVVGVVGGPESGIDELPLALVGAVKVESGEMFLEGVLVPLPRSPREALKRGIVLVPRDRLRDGGIGSLSLHENVLLPVYSRYWHKTALARRTVTDVINRLEVKPAVSRVLLRELSGGNQQKIILGKWLNCEPRLVILDDPTSGIDPSARRTIFKEVQHRAKRDRLGILLFSTEPEQLAEQCDRVIVIDQGRCVAQLAGDSLSYATVARWAAA